MTLSVLYHRNYCGDTGGWGEFKIGTLSAWLPHTLHNTLSPEPSPLARCPVQNNKLEAVKVKQLPQGERKVPVKAGICQLAQNDGISVLSSGVESRTWSFRFVQIMARLMGILSESVRFCNETFPDTPGPSLGSSCWEFLASAKSLGGRRTRTLLMNLTRPQRFNLERASSGVRTWLFED